MRRESAPAVSRQARALQSTYRQRGCVHSQDDVIFSVGSSFRWTESRFVVQMSLLHVISCS